MNERQRSRRRFVEGAAVGFGTLAAGLSLRETQAIPPPRTWTAEADVVIVGMGVAGAATAIEAADAGAKVMVLEKGRVPAGATPLSGGTVWLPLNPLQPHQDSVDAVIRYLTACGRGRLDEAMVRTFAENCKDTAAWLLDKVGAKATQPNRYDYHPSYPGAGRGRNFSVEGRGAGLMNVLLQAAKARNVDVRTGVFAKRLVVAPDGRIVGVAGDKPGEAYKANRAVVLATGGFQGNEAMKRAFLAVPGAVAQVPTLKGDGILMGMAVGAGLDGMADFVGVTLFRIPNTDRGVTLTVLSQPSAIMVNRRGARFCNESADYDTVSQSYAAYDTVFDDYANYPAWVVFDEAVRVKGPVTTDPGWSKDNQNEIQRRWLVRGDTIEALAGEIGVDAVSLRQTVDGYNRAAADGKDPLFRRGEIPGTAGVARIGAGPYYALPVMPGFYDTVGGLKINPKGQVLTPFDEIIPGLYATGTNARMAIGFYYPNGGTAIGQPLVFGRLAGRAAAADSPAA
jgi:3-oxosteroid 1-dehydrogenase